jgi:hypothetical protein
VKQGREWRIRNNEEIDSIIRRKDIQGGSNMTGTNCDLFTHK